MYEELVKLLRICPDYNEGCVNCPSKHDLGCRTTNMREAADAIEELSKQLDDMNEANIALYGALPHWIPVTERLPETSGVYLAWMQWDLTDPDDNPSAYPIEYDAEEDAFGWWRPYFDPESLGWAGKDFIRYEGVTHWMPLPKGPEEGET